MRNQTYLTSAVALAGMILAFAGFQSTVVAQDTETPAAAPVAAPGAEPSDAAAAGTVPPAAEPLTIEEVKAKWNKDLSWVSFIVDDGRVSSQRDYFGAFEKADLDAVLGGSAQGMVKVQQVFYYNAATRQFSRFDATSGGSVAILAKSGYFRPDSIMRIVPLNTEFVERLAMQNFLDVAGATD